MAQDFNNIPAGLKITTQIPLNIKENIINEATLAYLGIADNLAFTYHDQLVVTCLEEGSQYIWREVNIGEENTGLVPLDFTYPANILVYGITYSNKKFNFFKLPSLEQKYLTQNVGTGIGLYKNTTTTNSTNTFNFKKVLSDTIMITEDGDDIRYELASTDGVLSFIVNSDYSGLVELGTITKPFKNLQNALLSYKGLGTNLLPEFQGAIIDVQKDENVFTGSLSYNELNLFLRKGVYLTTNPAVSEYVLDCDSDATLPIGMTPFGNTAPCNFKITVEEGAFIKLNKQGFKNRGTNLNTSSSLGKIIRLLGKGNIIIEKDISVINPSVRTIISSNADNQPGFFNDSNVAQFDVQCNISTLNTKIIDTGVNSKIYFTNSISQFGDTLSSFNEDTTPYNIDNSQLIAQDCNFANYNSGILLLESQFVFKNGGNILMSNCNLGGNVNYLLKNTTAHLPTIQLRDCNHDSIIVSGIISSPLIFWSNLRFINTYFYSGIFNYIQGSIASNFTNSINGQIVETLSEYSSKAAAVIAGLFKGCSFIKAIVKTSGTFIIDEEYKITTIGTTDFTLIGASANTVGLYFTATGVGTGTGTATKYTRDTVI